MRKVIEAVIVDKDKRPIISKWKANFYNELDKMGLHRNSWGSGFSENVGDIKVSVDSGGNKLGNVYVQKSFDTIFSGSAEDGVKYLEDEVKKYKEVISIFKKVEKAYNKYPLKL